VLTVAGGVLEVEGLGHAGDPDVFQPDPLDGESAARAVQSGRASGTPRTMDAQVEMIRMLRVARHGAMKARIRAGA
jgi:hypothetical protein